MEDPGIKKIPPEEVAFGKVLGFGAEGKVHFGIWRRREVAVKQLQISEAQVNSEAYLFPPPLLFAHATTSRSQRKWLKTFVGR